MDFDHKIIDAIPALAWCAQPGGAKEFLNRQWRGYTGLSVEEGLGWGWKTAIHADDLGGAVEAGQPHSRSARQKATAEAPRALRKTPRRK